MRISIVNIEEILGNIKENADLKSVVESLENEFNEVMDELESSATWEEIEAKPELEIIDLKCEIVIKWINERLGSGYYAYNESVLECLRGSKWELSQIVGRHLYYENENV